MQYGSKILKGYDFRERNQGEKMFFVKNLLILEQIYVNIGISTEGIKNMQKKLVIIFGLALNSFFGLQASGEPVEEENNFKLKVAKILKQQQKCSRPECSILKRVYDCPKGACEFLGNKNWEVRAVYCSEDCAAKDQERHLVEDACFTVDSLLRYRYDK